MLSPLSNPTYARLFMAQAIAMCGTGLATVGLALLAYDIAGADAGRVLGTALAIKMVAYVTLAPLAGALAQQLPRRAFLIGLDLARAGLVACLPFVTEIWQIYTLIFLIQSCSAGFTPTFQATIPDILTDEAEYTKALALARLAGDLESLASPILAAAALTLVTFNAFFAFNALTFLASAALILTVGLPIAARRIEAIGLLQRTVGGLTAYLATPRLRGLLAISMSVAVASAMVFVNTVVYAHGQLGRGGFETALLLAAFGTGSMSAALVVPRVLDRFTDKAIVLSGSGAMIFGLLCGTLLPTLPGALAIWCVIGTGYSAAQLPAGRLLRRSSTPDDRPAYFAAQFSLSHACWLFAYPLAGVLGAWIGMSATFAVLATIALAATIVALLIWPTEHENAS
ncbi:MAG: MFS transporter [Pseudomonadota bacterium]